MSDSFQTGDPTLTFAALARSFLSSNPRLLDTLVSILHSIADELDGLKNTRALSFGAHMPPHKFKQKAIEKVMKKLGYNIEDIPNLCSQGRADELLQEIDRMERVSLSSTISPSRRIMPSSVSTTTHGTSYRFEDITDGSRKSSKSNSSHQ